MIKSRMLRLSTCSNRSFSDETVKNFSVKSFSRILKTYRICTAVRPRTMLRSMLVHPKDKISDEEKPEVVYKIPCKNCERVYFGETGRPLAARVKEHQKEVDSITGIFTRAEKTCRAASICNKSEITDHVCNENHVIDWENAKVIDRKSDKAGRHIREAIWITKKENMNRDEGSYQLSHVWDKLLRNDDRHRKSVLMKASDVKPKRR